MELIKNLEKINKNDSMMAGGKGALLGEMLQAGISVPGGFVVLSESFDRFIDSNNLDNKIKKILQSLGKKENPNIEKASEQIKNLILSSSMPSDVAEKIKKYFIELDTKFVAVRSSATAEDSSNAAWAGQLESYLNTTEKDLLENVKKCWASLFTPRAIFYRIEKGLSEKKISVAVVVQKMIDSEKSGVAFSVHPVTQDENQLIIEAGLGLGEAIVAGEITPDSYVIEKDTMEISDKSIQTQTRGLYRAKKGGNEWMDIPKKKSGLQFLSDDEILKLSKIIINIEKHYGFPCDIEWAFEKGRFFIVQSRPITTLGGKIIKSFDGKWMERGAETDIHLFPAVLHLRGVYLSKEITGEPIGTFLMLSRGSTVQYIIKPGSFIRAGKKILQIIKKDRKWIFKITEKLEYSLKKLLDSSEKIYKTDISSINNISLLKMYEAWSKEVIEMMKYGAIAPTIEWEESLLSEELKKIIKLGLINNNLNESLLGEYLSILTTPLKKLWITKEQESLYNIALKISKIKKIRDLIVVKNGNINDIKKINLDMANTIIGHKNKFHWVYFNYEGPEKNEDYFVNILKEILADKNNIATRLDNIKNNLKNTRYFQAEIYKKLKMKPTEKYLFRVAQELSYQKGIRRDLSFKAYWQITKLIDEISKRLQLSTEQVRNITIEEMKDCLCHNKVDKIILNERIELCATLVKDEIFSYLSGNEANILSEEVDKDLKVDKNIQELSGNVAYPGIVTGKIKIIQRKSDLKKMQKGNILVSYATNPELIPAIKKAAAIVTDEGGITCHAAIISREMRIPCVIGTRSASKVFKDGDLVEVDAERGVIKILSKKESKQ